MSEAIRALMLAEKAEPPARTNPYEFVLQRTNERTEAAIAFHGMTQWASELRLSRDTAQHQIFRQLADLMLKGYGEIGYEGLCAIVPYIFVKDSERNVYSLLDALPNCKNAKEAYETAMQYILVGLTQSEKNEFKSRGYRSIPARCEHIVFSLLTEDEKRRCFHLPEISDAFERMQKKHWN